jgi:hypothetical protein
VQSQEARQETLENLRTQKTDTAKAGRRVLHLGQNEDIGVLELVSRETPPPLIAVGTEQAFFYTDNVLLTETERIKSIGWDGRFTLDLIPYSTYRWTPGITLDADLVRYENASPADFDGQTLTFFSSLSLNEERSWKWQISYSLWRLVASHGSEGEFYKQGELINSLSWYKPLNAAHNLQFEISGSLRWRHVSPSSLDRISADVEVGLWYQPFNDFEIFPFAGVSARDYYSYIGSGRRDVTVESGATATWWLYKNCALRGTFLWVGSYSTADTFDYAVILPSISLTASIPF